MAAPDAAARVIQFPVPHAIIDSWVGTDLDRARLLADMTSAGGEDPTELASMLLDRFADDEQIGSSLAAGFLSGGWMGPYQNASQASSRR